MGAAPSAPTPAPTPTPHNPNNNNIDNGDGNGTNSENPNSNANNNAVSNNRNYNHNDIVLRTFINALMQNVLGQLPGEYIRQLPAQLLRQAKEFVKEHILAIGSTLSTTGLAVLAPSLAVVLVNALGFTSGGVAAGSIAAAIQSMFYLGNAGGVFSMLQAFGATAVVASPAVLVFGGIIGGAGLACLGWKLWKWYNSRGRRPPPSGQAAPLLLT